MSVRSWGLSDENEIKNIILKYSKKNFLNFKIIKLIYLLNQNEEGIKLIVDEIEEIINGEYSLNSLWNIYIHYG